ncbi:MULTISPECIES: flotillin domain-containing protein [Rhodopseudomonas]|uniref:flotillin family protein n=1 Tax=Rhodopseudomonas TaxID=1073 RepID=UPI001364E2C8|nr:MULTISPECIES: flotillin domain-containing protein [Rhodopseudomonas]MDF3813278.1 flotillin domain-containing protein [Rhodopseudomonas sp. BAL398]WOK17586.1 flotillin domain-containing protein [Rhodopseudomonas sp. BAL398]
MIAIIAIIGLAALFLNRFYIKASRELALVRTGLGGQRVVLDGGVLSLPIVHKVAEINMRTVRLETVRAGERSIITQDRLRIDATAEFYVRVEPTDEGVATAAQALGSKGFRAADLADILEGKLVDALLSVAAQYTMDSLQDNRGKYVAEVAAALSARLKQNGLLLEAVSLTRLDQTPFHALDQDNAFNAVGMRRLAEVIATNKRERAEIENNADVAVRQSHLDATKRRLVIDQEEEEAQLAQQHSVEIYRARTMAETAEAQATAEGRRELARIQRDSEVRGRQIEHDRGIRELELISDLSVKLSKHDTEIKLAAKKAEEAAAEALAYSSLAKAASARESVETARDIAVAERGKELAVIEARMEAEVDDTRVESQAGTVRALAAAEAEATETKARALLAEMLAKAEGDAAIFAAENRQSDLIIRMKTDLAKIDALPNVVREMVKPAEKIDSIRINHVTGFGPSAGSAANGANGPVVNQVIDGILSMALQLPAVQRLGEEIGINISEGIHRVAEGLAQDPPKSGNSKSADKE